MKFNTYIFSLLLSLLQANIIHSADVNKQINLTRDSDTDESTTLLIDDAHEQRDPQQQKRKYDRSVISDLAYSLRQQNTKICCCIPATREQSKNYAFHIKHGAGLGMCAGVVLALIFYEGCLYSSSCAKPVFNVSGFADKPNNIFDGEVLRSTLWASIIAASMITGWIISACIFKYRSNQDNATFDTSSPPSSNLRHGSRQSFQGRQAQWRRSAYWSDTDLADPTLLQLLHQQ